MSSIRLFELVTNIRRQRSYILVFICFEELTAQRYTCQYYSTLDMFVVAETSLLPVGVLSHSVHRYTLPDVSDSS
jgi:hypothetical protein